MDSPRGSTRDSTRDSQALEAILECAICLETFTDPRVLPCQHTICLPCLTTVIKAASQSDSPHFQCPTCRDSYQIPQTGAEAFPRNLLAISLVDSLTSLTIPPSPVTLATEDRDSCSPDGGTDGGATQMCTEHQGSEVKYYCKTCELAACSECCLETHHAHAICRLSDMAHEVRAQVEHSLVQASHDMTTLRQSRFQLESKKADVEHQLRLAKNDIAQSTETICRQAREHESVLLTKLDQVGDLVLDKISQSLDECDHRLESTERLFNTMEGMSSDRDRDVIAADGLRMSRSLRGLSRLEVPMVSCDINVHTTCEVGQTENLVGTVDLSVTDEDGKPFLSEVVGADSPLQPLSDFTLKSKWSVTGLAASGGVIYLTHFRDPSLWVYAADGVLHTQVNIPKMMSPCGLSHQGSNRKMAITDTGTLRLDPKPPCRLHMLTLGEDHSIAEHALQKLNFIPRSVTACSNGDWVISMATQAKFVVLHPRGAIKREVPLPDQTGSPISVFCKDLGYIVLESSKMTWFNSSFHVEQVDKDGEQKSLDHCVDSLEDADGCILVLDQGTGSVVHLFSKSGQYLRCLLEKPCDVQKPSRFCLDESNQRLFLAHQTKAGPRIGVFRYNNRQAALPGNYYSIDVQLNHLQTE